VALWDGTQLVDEMTLRQEADTCRCIRKYIASHQIDAAIGCSVDKSHVDWLRPLGLNHCRTIIELGPDTRIPIVNGYATPASLGADRLAAAVGAYAMFPGQELLVCDLGTACTYDIVSAEGVFMGGNIAPGAGMRLRALHHYTCRLPEVSSRGTVTEFGTDTQTAMRSGAFQGIAAEVMYYRTLGTTTPRTTILTGGWSEEVSKQLPATDNLHINKHLVIQGLNSILLYNEI
ncbi:MAG: type III pantothenate kinase, partial [Muribaculaceae bacterium]|nr:type III pantothenate kinase [Muribaculaceae bacterium]